MGLVIEKEKAGSDETHGEGNTKGDKKKRRGRRKEKDEGISEEESEEKGERKEAKGRERRKKRRSIWFGSSFAKVDKVTADDLIGRGEEGDDTFYEGKGKRIKLRERRGGGGKEEDRGKGKRKRQKERRGGSQDDRDLPRDFCPSLPDRQDDLHDLDDFLKTLERKSSCQAPRSSVPAGEILHLPPGPILPYQLRPRQASPDKVPLQPPKPASFENKLRQHLPRRRTSLETIEEDPLTFVFRESRMRSYPHEADLTCCVGEAGSPPGFLLTRSVTFSDLTWPGGEGDDPGSGVGNGEGGVAEAGSGSGASEGGTRRLDFGDAEFENDIDGVTKDNDDATVRIEGEMRGHASYGMTVSVYGVCDAHRAPPLARPHDVTRDEVREVLQAGLEELFVGWQEDDTYGMLAGLFREEDEDRGTGGEEKGIGDEERGKSDCREKGSREREDNGEGATNDEGGTEYAREGKARETARIENRLDMEDDEENETGDEGASERTENGVGERKGDEGASERTENEGQRKENERVSEKTENEGQRKENERVSERTENERVSERKENEGASARTENERASERKENERASARTENEGPRKENGDGEESPRPIPQLSFHIYIHQQKSVSESPSEEPYPRERDPQEAEPTNEESPKSEDENHETLSEAEGNGARGRPNEAPTWLRRQYRMNLVGAIQSLDTLNDQIVEFIFSGTELDDSHGGSPKQREALKASMSLMRRLLVDAQSKFRKMVEDNKQLASRIDGDLQTAHQEVNLLRQELADTNRRITQLQAHNQNHDDTNLREDEDSGSDTTVNLNGSNKYHSESSSNQLAEEMSQLRVDNEKLLTRNRSLQREVEELRRVKTIMEEDVQLKPQINQMTMELTHAKEALSALKADRKRLKAEKFDLLNQMKQLYATLEDKEKELRDFIRNYEQRMKESDESLRQLAAERDETEREKWNILKHARDESERVVKLSAELGVKETTIRKLQEELDAQFSPLQLQVRKQLISMGYHSDAESVRTNGLPTPTASTPACSPLPLSTPTPTPNGRGSSADSGVRLSSDRDSTASHEGTPTITVERGSLDCDTLSICSSATAASHYYYACGPGTPKESPSLSPLYATPVSLRGEEREDRGGDNTPTSAPTHSAASLNSSAMSGLASSNASTGGLSRSAEQLCERLAEAAESSKIRGCSTLTRKGHKGGGTWGSISRVFARQKKRAALDASLYDGSASDKRASWSPSSSLCASPLTEESYSEKLRLLEEAQHIPLERWKAPTVLAWLEVTLGMPQYGAMCAENIRSGKVLLELSDSELESGLGISHPMHRKKLRLAIEELREPRLTRFPRISALNHTWVSSEWLPDLGLPQYADAFANNLVDGRLLEALTKKELEKHLGVHRKFHQASIIHGVHLLRIVRFDRQVLAERRRQSEHVDCDPVVWTNVRWVRWARSVDLAEYADNLKDSGVHGALVVLESSFTADTMATALGIPQSKNIIRRHLATEMEALINPARQQIEEQARFAKMERRRQEKMAAGGSLGRSFSRSYGTGLEKGEKDKRRASLRGSLSRALGLRLREEAAAGNHNGGESSSSGGQSPAVSARTNTHHPHHTRPRSSVMPSAAYVHHETHRRVKSIGDIETITVTPV